MESRRICVRGLIEKDGALFAQKLKNKDGSAKNYWCTPGGGVDPLESLHDALTREMIEETGVTPQIGRLVLIQQFSTNGETNHGEKEQLEFFFLLTNPEDYKTIDIHNTSHGDIEIAEFGFVDPTAENLLPHILQTPKFLNILHDENAPVLFHTELNIT